MLFLQFLRSFYCLKILFKLFLCIIHPCLSFWKPIQTSRSNSSITYSIKPYWVISLLIYWSQPCLFSTRVWLHKLLQSCPILCDLMDCSPPGSSVRGIPQARILEWVAISYSRDFPDPGIESASLVSPALAGGFFTTSTIGEALSQLVICLKKKKNTTYFLAVFHPVLYF